MVFSFSKHKGNVKAAMEEFQVFFADRLLPGQALPSGNCFRRNAIKFLFDHTIDDMVRFNFSNDASTSQIEITQRALKQGGQGTSVWDFGAGPKNRRGSLAGGRPAICSLIVRDGLYFTLYGVRQWRGKRPELTNHFKCPNELPIAPRGGGDVQGE